MISVLMCNYNNSEYLESAIQSILSQSVTNFEFIIIDDGSMDESIKIIKKYEAIDERIVAVYKSNTGLVDSLNLGLSIAKYKYIARMDADDISLPNRFKLQVEFLEKNSEYAICGGRTNLINQHGVYIREGNYPTDDSVLQKKMEDGCFLSHPATMYRRDVICEFGGYRKEALHAEDYDLWLRVMTKHKVHNIDELVLLYRQHDNKVSFNYYPQQLISTFVAQRKFKLATSGVGVELDSDVYSMKHFESLSVCNEDIQKFSFDWINQIVGMYHSKKLSLHVLSMAIAENIDFLDFRNTNREHLLHILNNVLVDDCNERNIEKLLEKVSNE